MIEKLQELTSELEELKRDAQSGDYSEWVIECGFVRIREKFEEAGLPFTCTWGDILNISHFYQEESSYEESSY